MSSILAVAAPATPWFRTDGSPWATAAGCNGSTGAYVDDLFRINSTQSILCRLEDLYQAALVMAPARDWSWIRRVAEPVRARHVPAFPKRPRIVGANELYALGQRLMAAATQSGTPRLQAINYRDGLLVAFLAARPLRRRNLTALRIGETLVQRDSLWWIDIPGCDTKTTPRSPAAAAAMG